MCVLTPTESTNWLADAGVTAGRSGYGSAPIVRSAAGEEWPAASLAAPGRTTTVAAPDSLASRGRTTMLEAPAGVAPALPPVRRPLVLSRMTRLARRRRRGPEKRTTIPALVAGRAETG